MDTRVKKIVARDTEQDGWCRGTRTEKNSAAANRQEIVRRYEKFVDRRITIVSIKELFADVIISFIQTNIYTSYI